MTRCPYCAEIIQEQAIKCKHCGEFLEAESTSKRSNLIKQNFILPVVLMSIGICCSFLQSAVCILLALLVDVICWMIFRRYLKNFEATKTMRLVSWNIVFSICFILILIAMSTFFTENPLDVFGIVAFLALLWPLLFLFSIIWIVVWIILGTSLQKINDDFVGSLKELGMSISYGVPVSFLFIMFLFIFQNPLFYYLSLVVYTVPKIYMMAIFIEARKYSFS